MPSRRLGLQFPQDSLEEREESGWLEAEAKEDIIACNCNFLVPLLTTLTIS